MVIHETFHTWHCTWFTHTHFWHGTRHFGWLLISDLCNGAMCYMIKAWWIRRWYFLYISAFIVLYIVALSKPLGQDMKHLYKNMTLFYKVYIFYTDSLLLGYLFNHALSFHHHLIFIDFHMVLQRKTFYKVHDYILLNTSFKYKSWICINKTYVSHRHFYADVPIFTCVSGANAWWCLCFT